jgi:hypothetical protein
MYVHVAMMIICRNIFAASIPVFEHSNAFLPSQLFGHYKSYQSFGGERSWDFIFGLVGVVRILEGHIFGVYNHNAQCSFSVLARRYRRHNH